MHLTRVSFVFALVLLAVFGSCTVLTLPAASRSRDTVVQEADALVRKFGVNIATLTSNSRANRAKVGLYHTGIPFAVPTVVVMPGQTSSTRHTAGAELQLQFDSSGTEAFPTAYQQFLQSVFNAAQPTLDALFGTPSVGGTVHVANFDASIGDRQAIAGGYYLPDNGNGVPEIRFPIYNANEAAAVNFIHTLLLAYLGPDSYGYDAFEEGLVRAVTIRIALTAGALPSGLDSTVIQETLDNSYEIGPGYVWTNQRALGGNPFIAPNLLTASLPASGGNGPYLLRYLMAGSAWAKVLVEYPTFAAQLNGALYANPNLGTNVPGLISAGQTILTTLNAANPTVEGQSFSNWFQQQYILNTTVTQGNKLLVQPSPITDNLSGSDFGVFLIEATYFNTDASGNETLLSATSYPIYWDNTFARLDTSVQDEILNIVASDATVGPNFPSEYGTQPYAVSVDVPVTDQLVRVVLPAGAIATASQTTPNDFYGVLEGVSFQTGDVLNVQVTVGSNVFPLIPVTNGAFGATLGSTANYNGYATVNVQVQRTRGGVTTTLLNQVYDKLPGALAVDLQVGGQATYSYPGGLPAGISMVGLPLNPFATDGPTIFNVPAADLLLARYDSGFGGFYLYPNTESPTMGHSYFLNLPSAQPNFSITGWQSPNVSTSVALKPGWNMVTVPLPYAFTASSVRVTHAADFPLDYTDATGSLIGNTIFQFLPGAPDPAAGVPEGGTVNPITTLEPGVGYFVQVLAPEGVTLTFDPPSTQLAIFAKEPPAPLPGTYVQVNAQQASQKSYVVIGMSTKGSQSLNLAVDTELPPLVGGFQATVTGSKGTLFKDVRPSSSAQNFTIQLNGLTVGVPAKLSFASLGGLVRTFKVTNLATRQVRTMLMDSTWTFTPTSTSQQFMITLGAR